MKLYNILFARPVRVATRVLGENISKTDFFDLYSLISAHNEPNHNMGDKEHNKEIERRLAYELQYVFSDQMDQLFAIICERMMESDESDWEEEEQIESPVIPLFKKWSIPLGVSASDGMPTVDRSNLGDISYEQRARFLKELVQFRQEEDVAGGFTSNNGVWAGLAAKYEQLAAAGKSIGSMILAVDRIYGLCHHGGMLSDYFDERDWLEDALHTRSAGDPSQFLRYTSSDVRNLVGSAIHGTKPPEVTPLEKLRVSLTKVTGTAGEATLHNNKILLRMKYTGWVCRTSSMTLLMATTNGKPPIAIQRMDADCDNLGEIEMDGIVIISSNGPILRADGKDLSSADMGIDVGYHGGKQSKQADRIIDALKELALDRFAVHAPDDVMRL